MHICEKENTQAYVQSSANVYITTGQNECYAIKYWKKKKEGVNISV